MAESLTPTLKILLAQRTLSAEESRQAFSAIMTGQVTQGEIGAFLALLAARVPTSDELVGAARVMREHVDRVPTTLDPDSLVDTCGTGGAAKTFNVSTAAGIVACAAGAKVAKHGNRSRTGRGSAEVLTALGLKVDASREVQARCLEQVGICFCFAPHHHPATKHVMPVRQAMGVPTIFNLLGPLTNPAGAKRQVLGVYEARFLQPLAGALRELGAKRAMVLHSEDGLDELSLAAATRVVHVTPEGLNEQTVLPEALGLPRAPREAVVARDLDHAVQLVREVVSGREQGAPRDMTLLTAGAALYVGSVAETLQEGVQRARTAITSGKAQEVLEAWVACSQGA
jgi:anthranilate phosphoribosyltransferase